jgi:phosphoenolpyruvate carboxykinase (ATP)
MVGLEKSVREEKQMLREAGRAFIAPGIKNSDRVHHNLTPAALTEIAITRDEGVLAATGALVVRTGKRTGRSPKDRFIVSDANVAPQIGWGAVNQPMSQAEFARLYDMAVAYAQNRLLFVFDGAAGAHPDHRLNVRVITERAWQTLFARTLFLRLSPEELQGFEPGFTVISLPGLNPVRTANDLASDACIAISFERRTVLILGTEYAGEIKKSIFSVMNYLLPQRGVFPMHCAANVGTKGDVALFFGLSGTGKTTLSADQERRLIGDDEHGWADDGVFNVEGGCYAKTIRLSKTGEPQIWNAIRFGSVLENVVMDPITREPDYNADHITENTRATYPIEHITNFQPGSRGGQPKNVVFLSCDAFGVLPPISRLSREEAEFYFLSGYTAKVAGTEAGVKDPEATFSACFGAPFLPLPAQRYAEMFHQKLNKHNANVWLVNTGWSGGPAGKAPRIPLGYTRAMLHAALDGRLADVATVRDPIFNLAIPRSCPGVPDELLLPRNSWRDPDAYDAKAKHLARLFQENMAKLKSASS